MDNLKLERCPFCGGEARVQGRGNETNDYRVYCKECGCSTPMWSRTEAQAVEIWNRRAPLPESTSCYDAAFWGADDCTNTKCPYYGKQPCHAAEVCGGLELDNKALTLEECPASPKEKNHD